MMDNYPAGWEEGFRAGVDSQVAVIANLTARLKAFETGQTVPIFEHERVVNERNRMQRTISTQARTIIKLVDERERMKLNGEKS